MLNVIRIAGLLAAGAAIGGIVTIGVQATRVQKAAVAAAEFKSA